MSQNDLKEVKNLGKKSFEEILEKITEFGYAVGQELPADLIASIKKKIEGQ
jgi:DNA-directed RNA polymerase subunit alpha